MPVEIALHCLMVLHLYKEERAVVFESAKTRGFHTQLDEGPETP